MTSGTHPRVERTIDDIDSTPVVVRTVLSAVEAVTGRERTTFDTPLYSELDPEAASRLLANSNRCTLAFEYQDCHVTIDANGTVTVRHRTAGAGGHSRSPST